MNSDEPKVLLPVNGRPMIDWVMAAVEGLKIKPIVVVGYQEETITRFLGDRADYVYQPEPLGTGHAVACAEKTLSGKMGNTLVLYGDHPLISTAACERLFALQEDTGSVLSLATTVVPDFLGDRALFSHYGRIIRADSGAMTAIREAKDCSGSELAVTEVNPGYYCFNNEWLWSQIQKLNPENHQNEYYLTDLIEIAVDQKEKISSIFIGERECLGANTPEQLRYIESLL